MELNEKNKAHIDAMSQRGLLRHWRFASVGNQWFQGETGKYWDERMKELRSQPGGQERWVAASKSIGW